MGLEAEQIFWIVVAAIGGVVLVCWAILEHLDGRVKERNKLRQMEAREESRREIAAYVAEGSINPEDAAKLMGAGSEGFDGIKGGLRDAIAKGAEACREAGEKARAAGNRSHGRKGAPGQSHEDRYTRV